MFVIVCTLLLVASLIISYFTPYSKENILHCNLGTYNFNDYQKNSKINKIEITWKLPFDNTPQNNDYCYAIGYTKSYTFLSILETCKRDCYKQYHDKSFSEQYNIL